MACFGHTHLQEELVGKFPDHVNFHLLRLEHVRVVL